MAALLAMLCVCVVPYTMSRADRSPRHSGTLSSSAGCEPLCALSARSRAAIATVSAASLAPPMITPPPSLLESLEWNAGPRPSILATQSITRNSSSVTTGAAAQLKPGVLIAAPYMLARMPS